ncbi:ParA family protein [Pyramidobacter sp.]|uniref:ParA family protein n=2 Tax=Pyramidobacter sp. TaxID=1943581 RepID=UPI002A751B43|nr:ParA family protein [Pyramidobacter sp.]MDY3212759.1 ParA family protein [Pyramidobacter sp.]
MALSDTLRGLWRWFLDDAGLLEPENGGEDAMPVGDDTLFAALVAAAEAQNATLPAGDETLFAALVAAAEAKRNERPASDETLFAALNAAAELERPRRALSGEGAADNLPTLPEDPPDDLDGFAAPAVCKRGDEAVQATVMLPEVVENIAAGVPGREGTDEDLETAAAAPRTKASVATKEEEDGVLSVDEPLLFQSAADDLPRDGAGFSKPDARGAEGQELFATAGKDETLQETRGRHMSPLGQLDGEETMNEETAHDGILTGIGETPCGQVAVSDSACIVPGVEPQGEEKGIPANISASSAEVRGASDGLWAAEAAEEADTPLEPQPADIRPQLSEPAASTPFRQKRIVVSLLKGGVGKTTITCFLGTAIQKIWDEYGSERRLLVVDTDPQGSSTDFFLRDKKPEEARTLRALFEPYPFPGAAKTLFHPTRYRHIDLLPAHISVSDVIPSPEGDREARLAQYLAAAADDYSLILIDTPPSDTLALRNALMAGSGVFVPIDPSRQAIATLPQFISTFSRYSQYNAQLKLYGVIFSRYDRRRALDRDIRDAVSKQLGQSGIRCREAPNRSVISNCYNSYLGFEGLDPAKDKDAYDFFRDLALQVLIA